LKSTWDTFLASATFCWLPTDAVPERESARYASRTLSSRVRGPVSRSLRPTLKPATNAFKVNACIEQYTLSLRHVHLIIIIVIIVIKSICSPHCTREGGNYSDVLPLKAARRHSTWTETEQNSGNDAESRIYIKWVKMAVQFEAVCGPKFMTFSEIRKPPVVVEVLDRLSISCFFPKI